MPNMIDPSKHYVRAGEMITCQAGHEVARAIRDLPVNELAGTADFEWFISVPEPGRLPSCPCGERYMMVGAVRGCTILHFSKGWRTRSEETRAMLIARGIEVEFIGEAA